MIHTSSVWHRFLTLTRKERNRRSIAMNRQDTGITAFENLESRQLLTSTIGLVKDINTSGDSNPGWLPTFGINVSFRGTPASAQIGTIFYYAAAASVSGQELWRSDGTPGGTWLVRDISAGSRSSAPADLTSVNGTLYFSAITNGAKRGLWQSDGTSVGTQQVPLLSGNSMWNPTNFASFDGRLFFTADSSAGRELWQSDGTAAGTFMVQDMSAGPSSSSPANLTVAGGKLFFTANDPEHGGAIWKISSADSQPEMVVPHLTGPESLTAAGNQLYFVSRIMGGKKLYVTDGTESGTVQLTVNDVGSDWSNPRLAYMNGFLYFLGSGDLGYELWRTSGTLPGTTIVKDINPGAGHSGIDGMAVVSDTLYFSASSAGDGQQELWKSDGTESGTRLVRDIRPGPASSQLHSFLAGDGVMYFIANDGVHGFELWETDGTENGTSLVADLLPGQGSTDLRTISWQEPRLLMRAENAVFLSATNGVTGHELYVVFARLRLTIADETTIDMTPDLSWSPITGAASYELWIENISTGASSLSPVVTTTSFRPAEPLGIGTFRIRVRGRLTDGRYTAWSSPVSLTIRTPATFEGVNPRQPTSKPALSWNSLAGAVRYDLWIDNRSTQQSQVVRTAELTSNAWVSDFDLPMGQYRAWVRGIDAGGIAAQWSSPMNFDVVPAPALIAPLYATFSRQPTFVWTAVTGATKYQVFVRNMNNGATTSDVKSITTTSWTPPTNLADGPYRWWVQATSASNLTSLWSAPGDVYVGGLATVTGPVGSTSDATPTFTWRPVQDAVRYELWVSNASTQARVIHQTALTGTSYTPTANLAKGMYRVWVRAVSASGENAVWSAALTFSLVHSGETQAEFDQLLLTGFTIESSRPVQKLVVTERPFEQTHQKNGVTSEGSHSDRSEIRKNGLAEAEQWRAGGQSALQGEEVSYKLVEYPDLNVDGASRRPLKHDGELPGLLTEIDRLMEGYEPVV